MQPMAPVGDMPVIEIKIVKHGSAYDAPVIKTYRQDESQSIAVIGHSIAVGQGGGIAVLNKSSHLQNRFLAQKLV